MATSSQIARHAAATLKRLNRLPQPEIDGRPIVSEPHVDRTRTLGFTRSESEEYGNRKGKER